MLWQSNGLHFLWSVVPGYRCLARPCRLECSSVLAITHHVVFSGRWISRRSQATQSRQQQNNLFAQCFPQRHESTTEAPVINVELKPKESLLDKCSLHQLAPNQFSLLLMNGCYTRKIKSCAKQAAGVTRRRVHVCLAISTALLKLRRGIDDGIHHDGNSYCLGTLGRL